MPTDATATDHYDETLTAPVSWWLLGLLLVIAVGWCFLVATPLEATVVATSVAAVVVGTVLWRIGSVRLRTSPEGLTAGRATLPWRSVGSVEALDAARTREVLDVGADARAYLVIRPYCRAAVKVTLDDDVDPTPYWLISTRRADDLARHLRDRAVQD